MNYELHAKPGNPLVFISRPSSKRKSKVIWLPEHESKPVYLHTFFLCFCCTVVPWSLITNKGTLHPVLNVEGNAGYEPKIVPAIIPDNPERCVPSDHSGVIATFNTNTNQPIIETNGKNHSSIDKVPTFAFLPVATHYLQVWNLTPILCCCIYSVCFLC